MSKKVYNGDSYDTLRSFLKEHLEDKLIDTTPVVFEDSTAAAAEALSGGFDMLMEAYEDKKQNDVRQAFD